MPNVKVGTGVQVPNYILFGPDGSGKTTTAKALKGYTVRSYADPIKDIVHNAMGREPVDRKDKEDNFRAAYIRAGEAAKEMYGDDFWAKKMDYSGDNIVIDDARFMCELEEATKHGFIPIYLNPKYESPEFAKYDLFEIFYDERLPIDSVKLTYEAVNTFIEEVNADYSEPEAEPEPEIDKRFVVAVTMLLFGVLGFFMTVGVILYGLWTLLTMLF